MYGLTDDHAERDARKAAEARAAELKAEVAKMKNSRPWKRIRKLSKRVAELEQENQRLREEVKRADGFMAMDLLRSSG